MTSSTTIRRPSAAHAARSRSASASRSAKSITMKPSMRIRLTTSRPGTPIGPVSGPPSYIETAPQQAMRPCCFIAKSAAWRTGPPTLSK